MSSLRIVTPQASDWEAFQVLAGAEGWRVPRQELELYAGPLADSAFVLRDADRPLGFVTVVAHQRSGWIGNLLVRPEERRRGFGVRLFEHALAFLERKGVGSIWLTASEQGRPLYRRRGFRTVDTVVRWVVVPQRRGGTAGNGAIGELLAADRRAWQESRLSLLDGVAGGGRVFTHGETVLLLQVGEDPQVLGPWYSREFCPRENRMVLAAVMEAAGPGELVIDTLASAPVAGLLVVAGFERRGECALMVRGMLPPGNLDGLVALASLGSMG